MTENSDIINMSKADWFTSPALRGLFKALCVSGDELRVVGGAPRNYFLGQAVKDIDLATIYTPQEIIDKANEAGLKHIPTGIDHGTITVLVNGIAFEITSLREDVKTDGRHAIVKFGTDWLKDAKRRDFTINAIYVSPDGTVHDPLGTGLEDIKNKVVRFIGTPEDRIKEDHLRSLRFYRFAAYYSQPPFDQQAISATIKQRAGLRTLSSERVKSEVFKILSAPEPKHSLMCLYQTGLLTQLIGTAPNIVPCLKLCAIETLLNKKANSALRLGLLAAWQTGDSKRLRSRFKLSKQEERQVQLSLRARSFPDIENETEQNALLYRLGKDDYQSVLKVAFARSQCEQDDENWVKRFRESEQMELKDFPLTGEDLMEAGYEPGPELGKKLKELEEIWLHSNMTLSRSELLTNVTAK